MTLRLRTVALFLLLIALIPALAFAARKGRLVGKIVDPQGKPISGVTVTVTSPEVANFKEVLTTDRKGVFTVDFREIDVSYVYRFDKTGYQTMEVKQHWSKEGTHMVDWTMPLAPAVETVSVETAAPASTSAPAVEAFNTGLAAFKTKNYTAAATSFNQAVKHDPNLRQAWEALSAVQLELGDNAAAAAAAEKAISLGSSQESVYLTRWKAYRSLGDATKTAEALKDLEKIGRRTEEAKRLHNEAVALVKAGNHAAAFVKFQEAVSVDPTLQPALLGLATAGVKIGRNAEALTAAEDILKGDPKNEAAVRIRYNAALALGDKSRLADALISLAPYEQAVARNAMLKLAFEAYDANDNAMAKDRFSKVVQIDPKYPQAYYYLGVIHGSQGETAEARRNLERFLQLAPNDPEAKSAREMLEYMR